MIPYLILCVLAFGIVGYAGIIDLHEMFRANTHISVTYFALVCACVTMTVWGLGLLLGEIF